MAALLDYGACEATLIADPALPVEEVVYLLVFEGETPETQGRHSLMAQLSEMLLIPILDEWDEPLWKAAQRENLVVDLQACGDCREGYAIQCTSFRPDLLGERNACDVSAEEQKSLLQHDVGSLRIAASFC